MRLQEHSQPCSGRLEVFYNGTWGGVCQSLDAASLRVLCEHMGCGSQGQLLARPKSSTTMETVWLKSIQCRDKHDRSLWQCPSAPWNRHSCLRGEEAWLACAGELCCGFHWCSGLGVASVELPQAPVASCFPLRHRETVECSGFVDILQNLDSLPSIMGRQKAEEQERIS